MLRATIHQLSVSNGGVPKKPVPSSTLTREGLAGDWQTDRKHHGGPDRALCLFPTSLIERLRAEGHPISPGTTGENLTLDGLTPDEWSRITPGARLTFASGVEIEIVSYCAPCSTIRDSFKDLNSKRIKQELHPGESRLYARVLQEGTLTVGESATVALPAS